MGNKPGFSWGAFYVSHVVHHNSMDKNDEDNQLKLWDSY